MNKHSRKRSFRENLRAGREKNPNNQKDERVSSEEEIKSKKEKKGSTVGVDVDSMMKDLHKEMAKIMVELNETTTKDREQMEYKLDLAEAKLDTEKTKVKDLRAKYDAAIKRENRREKSDLQEGTQVENLEESYKDYSKCNATEKAERKNKCISMINTIMGMDANHTDFAKCRQTLLFDVLSALGVKTKLSVEEDLQFAIRFSLSDHTREDIKTHLRNILPFDIFAASSAIRQFRKDLCNTESWRYEEFKDKTGSADGKKGRQIAFSFYDPEMKSSLTNIIQTLVSSSKLNLGTPYGNVVNLVIQLDKGGTLTKLGTSISNLTDNASVGSPANFTILGLSSLGEDYESTKLAFGNLFEQINQYNGSVIKVKHNGREEKLTIRIKLGGDWKAISMITGHSGASSKHHCPICEGTKTVMKSWDCKQDHPIRKDYVVGVKNITKQPLIPSLTAADIVIPVNHVLTGVTKKAMGLLSKLLGGEASDASLMRIKIMFKYFQWNDEKEDRLQELSSSIAVSIGGLESVRALKGLIMEARSETRQIVTSGILSTDQCNDFCLLNRVQKSGMQWEAVNCTTCDKSNHSICGRVWNRDALTTCNDVKEFRCIHCRGETRESLMEGDKEHIEELEEIETELLENLQLEEGERDDLAREERRTSEKLSIELDKIKAHCGVYNRHYYADLVGEDARRLTRHDNAEKLWNLVDNDEIRSKGIQLFDIIHDLFKILHT